MTVHRAITFGIQHKPGGVPHPAGPQFHADGYIVVSGPTLESIRQYLPEIVGRTENGAPAYAFDYDLATFEARETTPRYYPAGPLRIYHVPGAVEVSSKRVIEISVPLEDTLEATWQLALDYVQNEYPGQEYNWVGDTPDAGNMIFTVEVTA